MKDWHIHKLASLVILAIIMTAWVLVNAQEFINAAVIFIILGALSIFLIYSWNKVQPESELTGIGKNWIFSSFIGLGTALFVIISASLGLIIGTVGIPYIPEAIAGKIGKIAIIVLVAPIIEEVFFRELVLDFFGYKITRLGYIFGALISSVLFAVFHLTAYGGSFTSASGSFITVFIAGIIFSTEKYFTKNNAANIVSHAVFNLWVLSSTFAILG